ncbi:MAG TPA: glycosyltransferase family 2 protein [Streptosporangiaceae bacterium]|nr:glycosyltransferase family 2 protein [Streptosporangiaceae bacterium]
MPEFLLAVKSLLVAFVIIGAVPLLVANYQFLLVGLHFRRLHYARSGPYFPRTAILIPAWNEAAVIGTSVDRLMRLDYPRDALRIYVVDDASTDETPQVIQAKVAQYPGNVWHLRRDQGGQGKAHTLNHGLAVILADDWMQAILIMDSDVIYERTALRRMTRHLADPRVGSVTAYIKEGSRPGNYMTRFIGYEYITAQAAARRSQEVLGVIACLAGGAQLHSRANIEAVGGRIDTGTLAEDTVTTFETQRAGQKVIFEPHATVWAEEPGRIGALWKQRLRWARGNIQVTRRFKYIWFRPQRGNRLGSVSFGLLWFCLLLLPVFMMLASASLVILYFIDYQLAWAAFHALWLTNVITYVFITSFTLLIDPDVGRHTWKEGVMFPGAVNVAILAAAILPGPVSWVGHELLATAGFVYTSQWVRSIELFTYVWLAGCMVVAFLGKVAEPRRLGRVLGPLFVYIGGYGPLLCAITTAAYVKELRHAEVRWEKTEKTGKVVAPT